MVMNTVHATYTETYDLNTALGEISLLAVHTPQATALKSLYKGFFENYKKYKIVGANLTMVCASQQSLSPSEIGLTEGQVDPRDVLNPILFKACTGENLNVILNQIYGVSNLTADTSSLSQVIDSTDQARAMYYQLLSDDSWRKSHPQRGLIVQNLKPFVHKVVTTQPFRWTGSSANENEDYPKINGSYSDQTVITHTTGFGGVSGSPTTGTNPTNPSVFISDGVTDMPWLDTTFDGTTMTTHSTGVSHAVASNNVIVSVPRVFCGCIILPPAILQRLFFRCQIQWHVMFKDFRPAFEVGPLYGEVDATDVEPYFTGETLGTPQLYNPSYWNIYHDGSTKLDKEYSSFDVNGSAEVDHVMSTAN